MGVAPNVVDLDDPSTWPQPLADLARDQSVDGLLSDAVEAEATALLRGHLIRAYHCTRLTPREIDSIRSSGLQILSPEFVALRIQSAIADGWITSTEAERLTSTHVSDEPNRAGLAHFFTDRDSLSHPPSVGWLLGSWGGEGINMGTRTDDPAFRIFELIGEPTVVITSLDLDQHGSWVHPGVLLAAARVLQDGIGGTGITSQSLVAPEYIVELVHPGDDFWKAHVWTPTGGYKSRGSVR